MRHKVFNSYYDRYRGEILAEEIYASGFLYWMYNTRVGHLATEILIKRRVFSIIYGWLHRRRWSQRKIEPFVKRMHIDTREMTGDLGEYTTFHEFFIREVDHSKRVIRSEPHVCISPVDGKVLVYPLVDRNGTYRIKRSSLNLPVFLRDEALADTFSGGSMAVCRLGLHDYHHFHFPDSGNPAEAVPIRGFCHAGGPYSLNILIPFFTENCRVLTVFESDHFGRMLIVEVGALTVGSIRQTYMPGSHVAKGARKGYFEMGSTVVLLFQKGAIEFDGDLISNTKGEIETYVRYGDSIGRMQGRV